jgi:hypothetical protein
MRTNTSLVFAGFILAIHLAWILWVIAGVFWTKGRLWLAASHLASLVWGLAVELGPWPCPLTLAEQFFEVRAGAAYYQGGFIVHYLDRLVYPDIPEWILTWGGVAVCLGNLGIYAARFWKRARTGAGRRVVPRE